MQSAVQAPVVDLEVVERVAAVPVLLDLHARRQLDKERVWNGEDEGNPWGGGCLICKG